MARSGEGEGALDRPKPRSRKARKSVEQTAAFFRTLVEHSLDIVAVHDDTGKTVFVSPSVEEVLGYSPSALLDRGILDFAHPDDREILQRMFQAVLADKGSIQSVECRVRHADNTWRTMAARGRYVARQGKFEGVVVNVRDVSKRRAAERALAESEKRFRDLVEKVPDMLWAIDESARFTYVSAKIRDLLGYEAEEVVGRTPFSFMTPEEATRVHALTMAKLAAHEPLDQFENAMLHKDGRRVIIETSGVPVFAHDGRFVGYRGVDRDVTEARKAQHLIEDLSRFPAEDPNPVLRIDPAGEVIYANEAARNLSCLIEEDGLTNQLRTAVASVREAGVRRSVELECDRQVFQLTLNPVAERGYVNVYGSDVTEIRRAEQQLGTSEASLAKVNRLLNIVRQCNAVLVRESDEATLLALICELVVADGRYPLALVVYADDDEAKAVRKAQVAGPSAGYTDNLEIAWNEAPPGQGPIGRAIRSGQRQLVRSVADDPTFAPWAARAAQFGIESVAAFPLTEDGRAFGALAVYSAESEAFDDDEASLLAELTDDLAFGIVSIRQRELRAEAEAENLALEHELEQALLQTIEAVTRAAETRDPYTAGHEREVSRLAEALAREIGLPEHECEGLRVAGLLHDIGKLQIPMEILARPTRLSELEYAVVKTHAENGYNILKDVKFPWPVADMILQHHERLDGSGYPQGLLADDIVLGARILAVADTVEAMGNHRPYRASRGVDAAMLYILQRRGQLFDAAVVDACLKLFSEGRFKLSGQAIAH